MNWDYIDIAAIRVARQYGLTYGTIAKIYGVTRNTIIGICRRNSDPETLEKDRLTRAQWLKNNSKRTRRAKGGIWDEASLTEPYHLWKLKRRRS